MPNCYIYFPYLYFQECRHGIALHLPAMIHAISRKSGVLPARLSIVFDQTSTS